MNKRIILGILAFLVAAAGVVAFLGAQTRLERPAYELRKLKAKNDAAVSPRPLHLPAEPVKTPLADLVRLIHQGQGTADARRELLLWTRSPEGRLSAADFEPFNTIGGPLWTLMTDVVADEHASGPDAVLRRCLDGLALGRDLARGHGIRGLRIAHDYTAGVVNACSATLAQASGAQLEVLANAARQISEGAPAPKRVLQEQSLFTQLQRFGGLLTPGSVALSAEEETLRQSAPVIGPGLQERFQRVSEWTALQRDLEAMELFAAQPATVQYEWKKNPPTPLRSLSTPGTWFDPVKPKFLDAVSDGLEAERDRGQLVHLFEFGLAMKAGFAKTGQWTPPENLSGLEWVPQFLQLRCSSGLLQLSEKTP